MTLIGTCREIRRGLCQHPRARTPAPRPWQGSPGLRSTSNRLRPTRPYRPRPLNADFRPSLCRHNGLRSDSKGANKSQSRPPPSRYDFGPVHSLVERYVSLLNYATPFNHGTPFFCFGLEQQASCSEVSLLRTIALPSASIPCTWKADLAISGPIVVHVSLLRIVGS